MSGGARPQLTIKAIMLGIALAAVLSGANAYLGLFAGMTVSASIPAAVISMGLLRLFRNSNILENNIVQTTASAGEAVAAGAIFTLPALILMDYWSMFDYWWVSAIAGIGGLLGVLFTIPLRRALIVDQELPFPEGRATAEVLRVGNNPSRGINVLLWSALAGALVKLATSGFKIIPGIAQTGAVVNGTVLYAGTNLSPALVAVGYIVGLNIAVLVLIGGLIAWGVAIPVYSVFFLPPLDAGVDSVELAFSLWSEKIRYLGVGGMLVGGVWALASVSGAVFATFNLKPRNTALPDTEHDVPMGLVLLGVVTLLVPMYALYQETIGVVHVAITMTVVMTLAGFLFSSVGGYMAGIVGSSSNPVSGMTIATITFASLLLLWLYGPSPTSAAAAILIGAVICCAAAIGGDNLQDLKAGYLLGATPWKQQLMQAVGVISAVLVMAPVLNLLLTAYGIGPATADQPDSLSAPQATLMAAVANGVMGGELPWTVIGVGAAIGMGIIVIDEWLRMSGARFRMPVLAVALGLYLPLELSVPIAFGGTIAWLAHHGRNSVRGVLVAAGLITGEALVGIAIAIPVVLTGDPGALALDHILRFGPAIGIIITLSIGAGLFITARQDS